MKRSLPLIFVLVLVACEASVSTKSKTSSDTHSDSSSAQTSDTSTPAPPPTPSATAAAASSTPASPSACPFTCFVADGANKVTVSAEDQEKLRNALASTMDGARSCVGSGRRGYRASPVVNVRVNSAGEVTHVGVDVHGYEAEQTCLEGVSHSAPDGVFSGPADIRCYEKCERPAKPKKNKS
jgi:hypothetical protein